MRSEIKITFLDWAKPARSWSKIEVSSVPLYDGHLHIFWVISYLGNNLNFFLIKNAFGVLLIDANTSFNSGNLRVNTINQGMNDCLIEFPIIDCINKKISAYLVALNLVISNRSTEATRPSLEGSFPSRVGHSGAWKSHTRSKFVLLRIVS